ncbi:hypothetical protein ACHHYP_03364 [Achlya hypogyna]|uniref:Transmembrane protein n=1 Tax=Achlya hypogyna TaxID=1202772 RepID=A0A1V9Z417_ACHHY|nr:hypothetical protein ACHHYP_03364 [Achlya hypogyna]
MARVADTNAATPPNGYHVRRNRVSVFLSLCSLLNIACMPMKAYISEYLPWHAPPVLHPTFANYSDFTRHMLGYYQTLYTNVSVPRDVTYYCDSAEDTQVMRQVLRPAIVAPIPRDECLSRFLLGTPGLIFYSKAEMDVVCAIVSATDVRVVDVMASARDLCFWERFLSLDIGISCLWLTAGDAVHGTTDATLVTLTYLYSAVRYDKWLWLKFVFRLFNTGFVLHRLWTKYYRHVLELQQALATRSHLAEPEGLWRYELVVGDPTAIILMDAWVAFTFVVDIWLSVGNVGVGVLRATQNGDLMVFFINTLYLSRTVWFAYWGLCVVAYWLKKKRCQRFFCDVDPTMVAIAVTIYGPLVSWLSGNVAFLTQLYQYLLECLVPTSSRNQYNELVLSCSLYTIGIACVPIVYGFLAALLKCRRCSSLHPEYGSPMTQSALYASHAYNTLKGRSLLALVRPFRTTPHVAPRGGTVYALFEADPRYKRCPTIRLCAADCYLLCYHNGVLKEKLRLSLLSSVELHPNERALAIVTAATPSEFVFNAFAGGTPATSTDSKTLLVPGALQLHMPAPPRRYRVVLNRASVVLSLCSLVNVASMPLKAYISEYVPWRAPRVIPTAYANYSDFNEKLLRYNAATYSYATLPSGATYYSDTINDVQVMRALLHPADKAPIARDNCVRDFLLGLPGLMFYTEAQMDLLCNLVAPANATQPQDATRGACFVHTIARSNIGTSCVWLTPGDAISGSNTTDAVTMTFTYTAPRYAMWLWLKFGYRLCNTCFVLYRMWTKYYRHVVDLRWRLQTTGHLEDRGQELDVWRYDLVLGDPTAIILMDPWVATAFLVDIWLSIGNVGIAILRASQNGDLVVNLINILYLSRTVWFAYCGLCITAAWLKKRHKQRLFIDVDPTMVAMGIAVYGPIVSWFSGNVTIMAQAYHLLFSALVSPELRNEMNDVLLGCIFYTIMIAVLPLVYGFLAAHFQLRQGTRTNYGSFRYNNIKNRALFKCLNSFRATKAGAARGGAVYALFNFDARYKHCPTISMRGADCFLLCHNATSNTSENFRLSLLDSLDMNPRDDKLTVHVATKPPTYVVNAIDVPAQVVMQGKSPTPQWSGRVEIHRPTVPSAWCF